MGVSNSLEIFQQKMNNLFQSFYFICAYIYDLLILTKGYWTHHVHKLELTLNKLKESGLKCNIEKYFFGQTKIEYLGLWVACDGVKPTDKIRSNKNMIPPTSQI